MAVANLSMYKLEIRVTKHLPVFIASLYIINTILLYLDLNTIVPSILGGISLIPLAYLYITSLTFKLCFHHRLFIYYILLCNCIDYIDYTTDGTLFTDRSCFLTHIILAGIFVFLYIIFKRKYDFSIKNSS